MKEKKTLKSKFTYGVGAIGLDLSYGMFYSYLAKYLTDILRLNKKFLLFLTPIARIWDGINDPMMGTLVDNTNTKFGKYRPWIIAGSCCNAVVLALMFTNPGFELGGIPLYIYVAVLYVLWGMTNTMADIPYWSMVPSFTSDPGERNIIATIARAFSGLGQGIISILTPIILPLLSVTTGADGEKICRLKKMILEIKDLVKKYTTHVTTKHITPHKFRSTYGTNLYKETGDIYLVADVLGHSDVNTTRKHYAAQADERRRMAAKAVHLRKED